MKNWLKKPLYYPEIIRLLPHRYPFLLVDKVTEINIPDSGEIAGRVSVGYKNITSTEFFVPGHFPTEPIFPGVLVVEALAQASAFVLLPRIVDSPDRIHEVQPARMMFAAIDNCRFRKPVVPGNSLILRSEAIKVRRNIWQFSAQAFLEDQTLAAEAELMAFVETEGKGTKT